MENNKQTDISIVVPVYNEEKNIKELVSRISGALANLKKTYEVVFVDDGSTDNTFDALKESSQKNKHLKIIRFRRNFGQSAALMAGLDYASGEVIITIDGDLQVDPGEIPSFLEKMEEGYDLVVGWQVDKYKKMLKKRIATRTFNRLTSWITGLKIHDFNCCFRALKNEVAKNIRLHGELRRYIPALAHFQGYRVAEIKVGYFPRKHGSSKYGVSKRVIRGFLDLITVKFLMTYLNRPIHFFGQIGLVFMLLGFLSGIATLVYKFVMGGHLYATQLPLLTVFSIVVGIQFVLMGLLAEILIRIYYEPRGNHPYSIKEKVNL